MDAPGPGGGAPRPEDGPPVAAIVAPRWSLIRLAIVALIAFVAAVATSTALVVALGVARAPAEQRSPQDILALALASDGVLLLALIVAGRALLRLRLGDLGFRRPPAGALRSAVVMAGLLWIVSIAVNALQTRAFGAQPQSLVVSLGAHTGPLALAIDLLTAAVVAPLAEETLFRGLIFGGLVQRMPVWAAAPASGLLFALPHGFGVLLPILALGTGLAYVYWRTGSIWAPILAHSLVNAVSVVLLFAVPRELLSVSIAVASAG